MNIKRLPEKLNFILFLISLFINLNIEPDANVWKDMGDPWNYLRQSKISFYDKEFFFPHKTAEHSPRPFTVPLFYKLADSNTAVIPLMQKYIHSVSVFFIVFAVLLFLKRSLAKYLFIFSVYSLMSWWNILGWTIVLLSESLSMSLLFCWIASYLILLKKKNALSLISHLLIMFLFSFTRDTWPYILLAFNLVFSLTFYLFKDKLFKKSLIVLGLTLFIFFFQQSTATVGKRYELPITNSILLRILPNSQYTQWFAERGMPCVHNLEKDFFELKGEDNASRSKIYAFYKNDSIYHEFFEWVVKNGKNTYSIFLLTHPSYTFFMEEKPEQRARIFAYNLFYPGPVKGYSANFQDVFPVINLWGSIILCILLIFFFMKLKYQILLVPVYLYFVFFLNVLLSYNADALEVERHMFITVIMMQLIGFFSIVLFIDNINLVWLKMRHIIEK